MVFQHLELHKLKSIFKTGENSFTIFQIFQHYIYVNFSSSARKNKIKNVEICLYHWNKQIHTHL